MRVLRKGGEFADSRIHFYFRETAICFVAAGLVLAVSICLGFRWPGLVLSVFLFISGTKSFDHWEHWFLGKRGEIRVTDALTSLPNDYVLLNDLLLPDAKGNVDHLLIGPNGLFVIETKNYSVHVKCEGDDWFVRGHRIKSLSRQAKRNAMAVRNNLESLFSKQGHKLPFIVPVLVFVKHTDYLNLNRATIAVLKAEDLVEFIRNYHSNARLTQEQIWAIVRYLQFVTPDGTEKDELIETISIDSREPDRVRA
jgi:Nuclease-related domain